MEAGTSRKWQYLCVVLLLVIFGAAYYALEYVPRHAKLGDPILFFGKYVLTYVPLHPRGVPAYVIPKRLKVWDSPAQVRWVIADLSAGERIFTNGHYRDWVRVRLNNSKNGWVSKSALMSSATYESEQGLLRETEVAPVQAEGHVPDWANLHISPSRDAPLIAELKPGEHVEMYARRLVERGSRSSGHYTEVALFNDVWYLVLAGSHAGWVLGLLVQLDIPPVLANYAQNTNVVAWFVLNTVNDDGQQVPQFLLADRAGTETADYTHIRVLTWWQKKQKYAIAYVKGGLRGYFPIVVIHEGTVPYFRLRLIDAKGDKIQREYGLFDTVTRPVETIVGWSSPSLPETSPLLTPGGPRMTRASYR